MIRVLLFGVYVWAPDFWNLPKPTLPQVLCLPSEKGAPAGTGHLMRRWRRALKGVMYSIGLKNYTYHEAYLRHMILWVCWAYRTKLFVLIEAPTARITESLNSILAFPPYNNVVHRRYGTTTEDNGWNQTCRSSRSIGVPVVVVPGSSKSPH